MESQFLKRHKKKSLLAALLLLLRRRGVLVLLVVLLASGAFLSPSSLLLRLPGGARLAAGVAWLAEKAGADPSRWGLGLSARPSFAELSAALRAAKENGVAVGAGWAPFFGSRGGAAAGAAVGPGSLGFVRGLGGGASAGSGGGSPGADAIKRVVEPEEARRDRGGTAVPLTPDELDWAGGRQGAGPALSGGAFAGSGFFNGPVIVASVRPSQDVARAGFDSLTPISVPASRIAGGVNGRLSRFRAKGVDAREVLGMKGAKALASTHQITYLAEAKAVDEAVVTNCQNCSREAQAAITGAVYDGHGTAGGVLDAAGDSGGAVSPPSPDAAAQDAAHLEECVNEMNACQQAQIAPMNRLSQLQGELMDWFGQMGGACSNPCKCGPCNDLKNKINGVCGGELQTVMAQLNQPCDLPSYCASLGVTPPSAPMGAGLLMCQQNPGKCGCTSLICDLGCLIGI